MPLSFGRIVILAGLSGFVALSWEILWARLYNFASGSRATAFGAMLGSYLLGLALGSLWSMRHQRPDAAVARHRLLIFVLLANLVSFFVVPAAGWMIGKLPEEWWPHVFGTSVPVTSWACTLPLVMLASAIQGITLPLLSHLGIPADNRAGAKLSYIYLANIIGSGLGSLLTGFVLLEHLTVRSLAMWLVVLGVVLGSLVMAGNMARSLRKVSVAALLLSLGLCVVFKDALHANLWEKLSFKNKWQSHPPFLVVHESRHGVITVDANKKVYGNGAYDGVINTKLPPGDYHVRPYFVSAVHPGPIKKVLIIGMSAGAWTQIVASHPDEPEVDVVEISQGYQEVLSKFPEVNGILSNSRITIHTDDGRRWLKRNPEERFDVILMNTTHHWREFASGLLSKEFLQLARKHLAFRGIVMWNCTDSGRAAKTGMEVFPHTVMCLNNCIGSLEPMVLDKIRWRDVLTRYKINGVPLYDQANPQDVADMEKVLTLVDRESDPMPDGSDFRWWHVARPRMEALWGHELPITDDNLGHEY